MNLPNIIFNLFLFLLIGRLLWKLISEGMKGLIYHKMEIFRWFAFNPIRTLMSINGTREINGYIAFFIGGVYLLLGLLLLVIMAYLISQAYIPI